VSEVEKALRDLAHYCEQHKVPKFRYTFRPPKGLGLRSRKIQFDRRPSPAGFALGVDIRFSSVQALELLLPDGRLWQWELKYGQTSGGFVDITPQKVAAQQADSGSVGPASQWRTMVLLS
jgi:hypothetical protein